MSLYVRKNHLLTSGNIRTRSTMCHSTALRVEATPQVLQLFFAQGRPQNFDFKCVENECRGQRKTSDWKMIVMPV